MSRKEGGLSILDSWTQVPSECAEVSPPSDHRSTSLSLSLPVKNQTPFAAAGKAGKYKLIASRNAQQISTPVDVTQLAAPRSHSGLLTRAIDWIRTHQQGRGSTKRLQVAATASFGDKRFVAVIRVDGREFLVGWGATNVALLAQLNERESFGDLLHASVTASNEQNIDPGMQLTSVQA